ncbi:MAG: DUF1573 domain-containing protein [Bacteroidales bacterium]
MIKVRYIAMLVLLFFIFITISCNPDNTKNEEKTIASDVIHNPATAGDKKAAGHMPVMAFNKEEHDFGRLIQGETVSFGFIFKNTGGSDLIIASVSSSCGCTVTNYPRDPVAPGTEGVVTVTFKTEGRRGFQHKTVTVMANTQPNTKVLKVNAEIRLPEEDK